MSLFSFNICSCFCLFHYSLKIATTLCCPLETITTLLTGYQSVQFSCSVMYDSLRPHESQHARPPCPSPTPGVHSNSCPSSRRCHPTISPSVVPFSSHLQSFPASGAFPMSQFIASHGQSFGASASVLPMNTQDWSPLGWTGWTSLQSKGLSRVFSDTTVQKHQFLGTQPCLWSNSHPYCSIQLLSHVSLLQPHGLQYARLPCPLPSPTAFSNSCPLSQWCHATILIV